MAWYKYGNCLQQNNDGLFENVFGPETATPHSGIYRCEGCGREIGSIHPYPLPPQNHHQHGYQQGAIRWRLIVAAAHR